MRIITGLRGTPRVACSSEVEGDVVTDGGRSTIRSEVQTIHRMNCRSAEANFALQSFVFLQCYQYNY